MRIIYYCDAGANALGVMLNDSQFLPLQDIAPDLPHTLKGLLQIEGWQATIEQRLDCVPSPRNIKDVRLLPVLPDASVIWCVGVNYKEHQDETGRGKQDQPMLFIRTSHGLIGAYDEMVCPRVSEQFDFEGELAVVIGKAGRHIARGNAAAHIAGYTIFNDGSIRDWQRHTTQFCPGKNFEGTGPLGPWMMTADEFGDPYAQTITTRLNHETVQHTAISAMDHKIDALIQYISTIHTIRPGDIISTGTPGGVGMHRKPPLWMKAGDVVSVEITGLGAIRNSVKSESSLG